MLYKLLRSVEILSSFLFLLMGQPSWASLKVIIDPGHGGSDRGAVYGKAEESKIVLNIAKNLKNILEKNHQIEVSLTRETDQTLSLLERVQKAEKDNVDLFISLHANAAIDKRAQGLEFYIPEPWSHNSISNTQQSNELSKKSDVSAIIDDLKKQNRMNISLKISKLLAHNLSGNIKQGPFYVISKTSMPAILIEVGFLSHNKDSKQLISFGYQKILAEKMADSIKQFCMDSRDKYAKVGACEMMVDKKIN